MPESTLEYKTSQAASSGTNSDDHFPQSNTPKPRHSEDILISVLENHETFEKWIEEERKVIQKDLAHLIPKLESATREDLPPLLETFLEMSQALTAAAQLFEKGAHIVRERMNSQCPELFTAISKLSDDDFNRMYASMKHNAALRAQNEQFRYEGSSSDYQKGNLHGPVSLAPEFQPSESEMLRKTDETRPILHNSPPPYSEADRLEMADSTRTLNAQIKPHWSDWRGILKRLPCLRG